MLAYALPSEIYPMSFANCRTRLLLSRVILLMLLFAQSLYAAQPCRMPIHEPAIAFNDMQDMGCHQKGSFNTCLQQCTADSQSTSQVQVAIVGMPTVPVLTVPVTLDSGARLPDVVIVLARSPDPPPSIRFCSLQL